MRMVPEPNQSGASYQSFGRRAVCGRAEVLTKVTLPGDRCQFPTSLPRPMLRLQLN